MEWIVFILVGLLEAGAGFFGVRKFASGGGGAKSELAELLGKELQSRQQLLTDIESASAEMRDINELREIVVELIETTDALRAERGRVTITQAELETVEGRLRELEEIEREFEASGVETQEEIKILKAKTEELNRKNGTLKSQLEASLSQIESLLGNIKESAVVQEQVANMKTQLVLSENKAEELVVQIELGNEHYFELKKRYDALDIEYAQLYEKFSEAEEMLKRNQPKPQS